MTDLPPRPPYGAGTRPPEVRKSQTSMWLVLLVVAAVILAVIAFTVDRSDSVVDVPVATEPATTEIVPVEPTPAPAPAPTGTDTGGTDTGTTAPTTPPAATTGETTEPAP